MNNNIHETDVLIIGKGIAGVRAANEAVRAGLTVTIVNKAGGASPEVMGFNTTIGQEDSEEVFLNDTLKSGSYINNKEVLRRLVENANDEVAYLEELGLNFDKNPDGTYNLMQTLGSSYPRMVHYQSLTGATAMKLIDNDNIKRGVQVFAPFAVIGLLDQDQRIVGASAIDMKSGELVFFRSKAVVIATGGCGDIYPLTTYPSGITGDGYAMAYRAGAELVDMEFLQYDPCGFVTPGVLRGRVMVTTLLNEGAEIYNADGQRFIINDYGTYNIQKSELSRRMYTEIAAGKGTELGGVYYDMTKLPYRRIAIDHNLFYDPAFAAGVDMTKTPAEVAPLAHSCVGGVVIDRNCATTLAGLFAAGETAGGIHGANRIGGNAGTEIFVYGKLAGKSASLFAKALPERHESVSGEAAMKRETERYSSWKNRSGGDVPIAQILDSARGAIHDGIGIIRNEQSIMKCQKRLSELEDAINSLRIDTTKDILSCYTLQNILTIAKIQTSASLMRKESRGVFFRDDYPAADDVWKGNIFVRYGNNEEMELQVISTDE